MKIAVVNTMVGFVRGGAEVHAEDLCSNLERRGHKVDLFRLPCPLDSHTQRIVDTIYTTISLRLDEYDRIIPMKFPMFYIMSKNKVVWMCHQFRPVYDQWNNQWSGFSEKVPSHVAFKELITDIDNRFLTNARHIYTNGIEVAHRLKHYNNIESTPLYPPLEDPSKFYFESVGDYIYYPSRVNEWKRQHLLVEAFAYTKSNVKLIISGAPDLRDYLSKINYIINKHNISSKVKYIDSWISEEDKLKYYANSLAVGFIPYLEDYGYITAEAMHSKKAVITCTDSGGPKWIVEDGKSGFVVEPDPKKLAEKIDYLYNNREEARKLGEAAYERILSLNMSWDNVIDNLLK